MDNLRRKKDRKTAFVHNISTTEADLNDFSYLQAGIRIQTIGDGE